ncbi:MAG: YdcF family protein [Verrucomicrobia bacterium]|nr:YdcF family protein [Verrucomicrobiota bacterium]
MKRFRRLIVILLVAGLTALVAPSVWIMATTRGKCTADLAALPHRTVGLVLGTSRRIPNGGPNFHYANRMEAAARLFKSGKVDFLLLSGSHSGRYYDESAMMADDLVQLGVPRNRLVLDREGFRTLDSVVRAGAIYGQQRFIVVSQRFHNQRAIFLARAHGYEAVGFDAPDVGMVRGVHTLVRECFARVAAVIDVVSGTQPRTMGEPILIGGSKVAGRESYLALGTVKGQAQR